VLPITGEPLHRASVTIEDGRIAGIEERPRPEAVDLGRVAILPSLVNAHTHLELSHLRGVIPPSTNFLAWIGGVMASRRNYPDPEDPRILDSARAAIAEARASGTGLVGDISNTLVTAALLRDAGMPAQLFYELLKFNATDAGPMVREARAKADAAASPDDAAPVRISLAPHAPYSVAPSLFNAIRADLDEHPGQVSSVHLGESAEEVEFIKRGTGPWRAVLQKLNVWTDEWTPPGTSPVEYLDGLGFLDRCVLAVHGVQFDGHDLDLLRARGVTVVACPRSNQYVGVGSPPIEAFYATQVDVAFGTDSLASVQDLNLFAELAEARRLAPRVPARTLLESATLKGAEALGFDKEFGSIEPRKRASLIAVHLRGDMDDVEEYLVSGVRPADVTWVS
jgi:cytosine/adenosine deaminase-related metal-dependent hydrolase